MAGRDQQILGKVHKLVGTIRGVREAAQSKVASTRQETKEICLKHGGRLLDVANDFISDLKKTLFK